MRNNTLYTQLKKLKSSLKHDYLDRKSKCNDRLNSLDKRGKKPEEKREATVQCRKSDHSMSGIEKGADIYVTDENKSLQFPLCLRMSAWSSGGP